MILEGLVLSIVLHGIFNALLSTHPSVALGLLLLVPVSWKMVNRRIEAAFAGSPHRGRGLANPRLAQQVLEGMISGFHPYDQPQVKVLIKTHNLTIVSTRCSDAG